MTEIIKMNENKKAKFKVDSHLITQILGSEIIESHSIAFAEQIKNAQDAGSNEVTIDFSNMKNDEIIITDNGNGMSELEVEEEWFLLGNSKKNGEASTSGGKGIGRLSLFKIGDSFQVKTSNGEAVTTFSISNKELIGKKAESFEIDLYSEIRNENIGTQIKINELDNEINLEEIELELNNLLSNDNKLDLKIIYPVDFESTTFLSKDDVEKVVPFSASIFIDFDNFNKIEDISYNFTARLQNEIVYKNTKFLSKFTKILNQLIEKKKDALNIGNFSFDLTNFFFDNKDEKYLPQSIKDKSIRGYFLKVHQGINIYRNGFKIYGHGSEDWLKLAENRVSKPGENIDNKLSHGVIILDNEKSELLKEKSNREGFIRNESSKLFKDILSIIVKQFGQDRHSATKEIRSKIQFLKSEEERQKVDIKMNEGGLDNSSATPLDKTSVENNNTRDQIATKPEVEKVPLNNKENPKKILKIVNKKIEHGDTFYLKDTNIVNSEFVNELKLICSRGLLIDADIVKPDNAPGKYTVNYIYKENSEKFNLIINERKIIKGEKANSFFKDSNHLMEKSICPILMS
ncbi:ATP-binding protein [Listeria ivanovii]|uniref:ATP-binding protein n=1 Tax=Listeria ivanovii TaxID=1638 RepID=UPI00065E14C3|nr:ATP-binding protein [Listeria ivanovii]